MRICEYTRQKHGLSMQKVCEDLQIDKKDYKYFVDGIKTPPAGFVLAIVKYFGIDAF
jgi:hypothetical protein